MKIVTSEKEVWLSHFTFALFQVRHVIMVVIVAFWNPSILFLLPFFLFLDAYIRFYLLEVVIYRYYLKQIIKYCKDVVLYDSEDDLINKIVEESEKYEINEWLLLYSKSRNREKKNIILINNKWNNLFCTSFSSVADYNIIILPKIIDPHKLKHAVMVAHEFSHSMGHDMYKLKHYYILIACFVSSVLFTLSLLYYDHWWPIAITGICSVVFLLIKEFIFSSFDKEFDADIGAIRYFENMKDTPDIKTNKGRTVLEQVANDIAFIRCDSNVKDSFWSHFENKYKRIILSRLWPFLREDDRQKYLSLFPKLNPPKPPYRYNKTEDVFLVIFDVFYVMALFVLFVTCISCAVLLFGGITVQWYWIFGGIIPVITLLYSLFKSNLLWQRKKQFLEKIGCI